MFREMYDLWKHRGDMPDLLYSDQTGDLLRECLVCHTELISSLEIYIITKNFSKKEPILEYAICMDCYSETTDQMSERSQRACEDFIKVRTDFDKRRKDLLASKERKIEDWVDHCIITGKPRSQVKGCEVTALCLGDQVVYSYFPLMVSEEGALLLHNLLSKRTKEILGDFSRKHFDFPALSLDAPKKPVSMAMFA